MITTDLTGRPGLAAILEAEARPDATVRLPVSGRDVTIQVLLRRETRHRDPVPRAASCWAPNKPSIDLKGHPTFPEFVLVQLLEAAGWEARWIKHWSGGREFCVAVDRPRGLPPSPARQFTAIHERATALRGAGSWDVFAWRGDDYLFIESKQHRSSDRLNDNQLAWLEAALDVGVSAESFAIVEYDAGRPAERSSRSLASPRRKTAVPAGLARAMAAARAADPSIRIEHRDAIAGYGPDAIGPMVQWFGDDQLRRFAITVLGVIAKSEPEARRQLKAYGASSAPDAELAGSAAERAISAPERSSAQHTSTSSSDVYLATGRPPNAQGPCDIRNRDGSPCQNPGRHPVGDQWSCTTHYKALTRRGQAS